MVSKQKKEVIPIEVYKEVKDEWETPPWLFEELNEYYQFTLDAACTAENQLVKGRAISKQVHEEEKVYCNPPYSNWRPWVEKAYNEVLVQGRCPLAVLLLPVDTSTKAFHEYIWDGGRPKDGVFVHFINKRLRYYYKGLPGPFPARFSSMVVVFKGETEWQQSK
jgi:site-specific DNA-methyltransferase (adenine-specific)